MSLTSSTQYGEKARIAARVVGTTRVELADPTTAAAMTALWFVVAFLLAYVGVTVVWGLTGIIGGQQVTMFQGIRSTWFVIGVVGAIVGWFPAFAFTGDPLSLLVIAAGSE